MDEHELTTLRVGDHFVYRGRHWVFADYAGWTWGDDERGEYARFKCWPERGGPMRFITVRPTSLRSSLRFRY